MSDVTTSSRTVGQSPQVDGAVDALRRSVLWIRDAPEIIALFVVVAPLTAVLGSAGGIVRTVGVALAVYLLGLDRPGSVERGPGSNSVGVRILVLILAAFVSGLVIVVGLLLLVVPGLYLFVRLYLVVPAVVLGDDGPLEALGSSWERTDGHALTVAGVAAAVSVASTAVSVPVLFGIAGGVDPAVERVVNGNVAVAQAAGTLVGGPLTAATMAVLYDGLPDRG